MLQRVTGARRGWMLLSAATLTCALAVAATAGAGPVDRRSIEADVSVPRQPIGAAGARARGALELSREYLLAGRAGQSLRVRHRLGAGVEPPRGARVVVRRIRTEDPRHPGVRIGGERLAAAPARVTGRRIRARLAGLDPAPGPHRVLLRADGERIAGARIEALAQSRTPQLSGATSAARARRSSEEGAPTRRSLAAGEVNHDLSFRPGSEASSAIAVQAGNPDRVIAASNDAGAAPLAFVTDDAFTPGPDTVRELNLPGTILLPTAEGGGRDTVDLCCDPAVAADDAGNLWMAVGTDGADRIVVNRIAAGTKSFRPRSVALPVDPDSGAQHKPALAVDPGESIAAVWIETESNLQNVVYSGCDLTRDCDDPDNWSAPEPVTSAGGQYPLADVGFAPNGDLYSVWWDQGADNAIEIDRCEASDFGDVDLGKVCVSGAWDEDAKIADLDDFSAWGPPEPLPLFCPIIGAPGGLVNPAPSVEVGPAGNVYVAWSDLRDNADPTDPTRCTASGSDSTFDSFVAAGAANSFPPPNSGVRLSADDDDPPAALNDHFLPALTVDPSDGEVEASFYSTADDPGGQHATREYVAAAGPALSLSSPVQISNGASRFAGPLSDGIDYGDRQGADSAAGVFRPAWTDAGPAQGRDPDLYVLSPPVETTIEEAPSGTLADPFASFEFSSPAPRIECTVSAVLSRRGCSSPLRLGPLKNASYTASFQATDRAGNVVDESPATASWTVADLDPPETTLTKKPPRKTRRKRPRFTFKADEIGAKFQCRYDRERWKKCKSPKKRKVSRGKHVFRVRAFDVGGNTDPSAAKWKFKRQRKCTRKLRRRGRC